MNFIQTIVEAIDNYLEQQGSEHSSETSEHDLIQYLIKQGIEPFDQLNLSISKDLFGAHFLTHHALYLLQDRYIQSKRYRLDIALTKITRQPYYQNEAGLTAHDGVKSYYLDFENYLNTGENEVNELLRSFWDRYLAHESKHEDLQILELPMDASYREVKVRYRQLAQTHHPDKGGDPEYFAKLAAAKANLDKAYQR